jgi:glutamate racemase
MGKHVAREVARRAPHRRRHRHPRPPLNPLSDLRGAIEQGVVGAAHIVDSAETTAETVKAALGHSTGSRNPARRFLVTDTEERFRRITGKFLEQEIEDLELVSLVNC